MKYVLDTDHISILQWRSEPSFTKLSARLAQLPAGEYGVSIVSLHEQSLGCQTFLSRAKTPADFARGYRMFELVLSTFSFEAVLAFDIPTATRFLELRRQHPRVSAMDLRIAAIALERGLVVLTRNSTDFSQVAGLTIDDWTR